MKPANSAVHTIFETIREKKLLSLGILVSVCGAVVFSLFPPLVLGRFIDTITAGHPAGFSMVAAYFGLLALTGVMESLREALLTVFGQKITHNLRSRMMDKFTHLTADTLNSLDPGAMVSRFVGDVDTV
ncbi:MAG: ABC transporter transmembrane domain-containing protein, partial [Oscillospiraceae bacterium]|nr:ABC transporter transmembrane domain-containing protein [Oscillospiraceae bacterium]